MNANLEMSANYKKSLEVINMLIEYIKKTYLYPKNTMNLSVIPDDESILLNKRIARALFKLKNNNIFNQEIRINTITNSTSNQKFSINNTTNSTSNLKSDNELTQIVNIMSGYYDKGKNNFNQIFFTFEDLNEVYKRSNRKIEDKVSNIIKNLFDRNDDLFGKFELTIYQQILLIKVILDRYKTSNSISNEYIITYLSKTNGKIINSNIKNIFYNILQNKNQKLEIQRKKKKEYYRKNEEEQRIKKKKKKKKIMKNKELKI